MKKIWTYVEKKDWSAESKYQAALAILCTIAALCGLLVWIPIHFLAFSSLEWAFCFMGYPALVTWIGVFLYACYHDFHNGSFSR